MPVSFLDELLGVWGGTVDRERRAMRRSAPGRPDALGRGRKSACDRAPSWYGASGAEDDSAPALRDRYAPRVNAVVNATPTDEGQ